MYFVSMAINTFLLFLPDPGLFTLYVPVLFNLTSVCSVSERLILELVFM